MANRTWSCPGLKNDQMPIKPIQLKKQLDDGGVTRKACLILSDSCHGETALCQEVSVLRRRNTAVCRRRNGFFEMNKQLSCECPDQLAVHEKPCDLSDCDIDGSRGNYVAHCGRTGDTMFDGDRSFNDKNSDHAREDPDLSRQSETKIEDGDNSQNLDLVAKTRPMSGHKRKAGCDDLDDLEATTRSGPLKDPVTMSSNLDNIGMTDVVMSERDNDQVSATSGRANTTAYPACDPVVRVTDSDSAWRGYGQFPVKDWQLVQTLGEGAYGEVKLAYNRQTTEAVAVKIIETDNRKSVWDEVRKEVSIHRLLRHKNIVQFYGARNDNFISQYLFMEFCIGGELFDRIEPDVGMPQRQAQKFFTELISGLGHIHSRGIAHRDIKPENLLIDHNDILKIADFGLATLFCYKDQTRLLNRLVGSGPYLAPEVYNTKKPYHAEPADTWSCGIVLVAMLSGELPWDHAVFTCPEYCDWCDRQIQKQPWSKIDNVALGLLRRVLANTPKKRYAISDIRDSRWFRMDFSKDAEKQLSEGSIRRDNRLAIGFPGGTVTSSQPTIFASDSEKWPMDGAQPTCPAAHGLAMCFSQPTQTDSLLLSSQLASTQSSQVQHQTAAQKLVRRMTRFFTDLPYSELIGHLSRTFDRLGYRWRSVSCVVTVEVADRRGTPLVFKATVLEMDGLLLVDFRRSKGDGLEFKRHFILIMNQMKPYTCKPACDWPSTTDF